MMRMKESDINLIRRAVSKLESAGDYDLAADLKDLVTRYEKQREITRKANKDRAAANRNQGYRWPSSHHPKKSKYREEHTDG